MLNLIFILSLGLVCAALLWWAFSTLPGERWQMIAALPVRRNESGGWQGINLTWYGLLTANAYLAATALLFIYLGSIGIPLPGLLTMTVLLLLLCMPAAKLVAWMVEGSTHNFTVGGAVFVGLLAAPGVVWLANQAFWQKTAAIPVLPTLAAMATAYAFGEGLGRLACLSFGCCYGKPVCQCGGMAGRIFRRWNFAFVGSTKKIAYASGLEGKRVVPVQALTAALFLGTGLAASWLFLEGFFGAAFLLATLVTQAWRVWSETLRADYRGGGRLSAYQVMGLLAIPYALIVSVVFGNGGTALPALEAGLRTLWQPAVLLSLQGLWILAFLYTGRSTVTGSVLSFYVHRDRVLPAATEMN